MKVVICIIIALLANAVVCQQCPEKDGLYPDRQQCDAYITCKDGVGERELCPDGLLFNDRFTHFRYPCSYPGDVQCGVRSQRQAANPTENCPHQYGMFSSGQSSADCGTFVSCVEGKAYHFNCPEGLAFSEENSVCLWPDEVPSCDSQAFLGFQCPGNLELRELLLSGHPRLRHPEDCKRFFTCINGTSPRLHTCGQGTVYNENILTCDEPENVPGCENYYPPELLERIRAANKLEEELRTTG